jgi:hypothetical protein
MPVVRSDLGRCLEAAAAKPAPDAPRERRSEQRRPEVVAATPRQAAAASGSIPVEAAARREPEASDYSIARVEKAFAAVEVRQQSKQCTYHSRRRRADGRLGGAGHRYRDRRRCGCSRQLLRSYDLLRFGLGLDFLHQLALCVHTNTHRPNASPSG